jgi:polysaccharide pyruvyl transferase WcaK-like protein
VNLERDTTLAIGGRSAAVVRLRRPTRILLFGLFGCGNLGNEGSLDAMLETFRRACPDAELLCICDQPRVVAGRTGLATASISRSRHLRGRLRQLDRMLIRLPGKLVDLLHVIRHVSKADVLIIPGTGILDDFGERPYGMPLDIFLWCLAARATGTKLAMVSIGAGPIGHPLSRRLMGMAARLAGYRSYRDQISRDFMESIGIDTSGDPVYPDLVFGLEEPTPVQRPAADGGLTVGVGLMSYYGWYGFAAGGQAIFDTYLSKMTQFVLHLLDGGHRVRLLTGEEGDETAVRRVLQAVGAARPSQVKGVASEPIGSLRDLMGQIAQTDLIVATRFHNIVCALKMGKPAISLGYSRKNDVLMADFGLGDYCQHVEQFEVPALIGQFSELAGNLGRYERKIAASRNRLRSELRVQEEVLISGLS